MIRATIIGMLVYLSITGSLPNLHVANFGAEALAAILISLLLTPVIRRMLD